MGIFKLNLFSITKIELKTVGKQLSVCKSNFKPLNNAFQNLNIILRKRNNSLETKKRVAELARNRIDHTIQQTKRRIEAAEIWFYRRIMGIPWQEHVSNQEV